MTYLYPLLAIASLVMTAASYPLALVLALFLDEGGNLKYGRSLWQPSDNPAIGDLVWQVEHPTWSDYRLALFYMWRNPAQPYLQETIPDGTPFKTYGNPNIKDGVGGIEGWSLVTTEKYFHLTYILDLRCGICARSEFGWRLGSLVGGYQHKTRGQIVCTPLRFYKFTKG